MQVDFSKIKFDEKGLIPAIIQDAATNAVLMLAYMNGESLAKTVETGYTWFWSRSRQELWNKGASSGHVQKVVSIDYDCDGDSLLVKVEQKVQPAIQEIIPVSVIHYGTAVQAEICRYLNRMVFTVFWLNCTASFRTNASMAAKNLIPVTCLCQDRIRF